MAKPATFPIIGFVILFTVLFHNNALGLNLVIFEIVVLGYFLATGLFNHKTLNMKLIMAAQVLTSIATVIIHSSLSYVVHYWVSLIFSGVILYTPVKSFLTAFWIGIESLVKSQMIFLNNLKNIRIGNKQPSSILWESRLMAIPAMIIFLFVTIYNFSNPKFNAITSEITLGIFDFFRFYLIDLDLSIMLTMLIGLIIANFITLRESNSQLIKSDSLSTDVLSNLNANEEIQSSKKTLNKEMHSAIFLLFILNAILLTVNIIDINWVWLNFKWEGQYLKQFVHEGTWLLIISILLSIAIVLYYFRGALNFEANKTLKYLSYIWLIQNAILAISVAIRNIHYITNFNLAYKRIGVIIFLVLTLYGLITVYIKVKNKYSPFYLFRTNFHALLTVLIICSFINWDTFIAKYNFNHSRNAFIHFNFLARLSDESLPFLDKTLSELKLINEVQKLKYPQEKNYMTPENYHKWIQKRKIRFRENWETKGWLSWNLPEQLAYNKLFKNISK